MSPGITRLIPMLAALLCIPPAAAAPASAPCEAGFDEKRQKVAPGVTLITQRCTDPLYLAFVTVVDLTREDYTFFVTPYDKRRTSTSKFAETFGAVAAVNGGFWEERGGFTVSDGKMWPKHGDNTDATVVGFGDHENGKIRVDIRPTREVLEHPASWMRNALTGYPMALRKGKVVKRTDKFSFYNQPRTAVALDKKADKFYMLVVDGRQPGYSLGLRLHLMGELLRELGASHALNLDGGRSSTMVIPSLGGLLNKPCTRKYPERHVPNHLGLVPVKKAAEVKAAARSLLAFLFGGWRR